MRRFALLLCALTLLTGAGGSAAEPPWQTLPPTPVLPKARQCGYAPVNGIQIWYAVFGRGEPVIFLHGGLANVNCWGHQVPTLVRGYSNTVAS
jgi:hypothetical protein